MLLAPVERGELREGRDDGGDDCIMAVKRSVVGSGPIRCPGKSRFSKDRIKDVFPTEYLKYTHKIYKNEDKLTRFTKEKKLTKTVMELPVQVLKQSASKSLGESGGEPNCENLEAISSGST
jgi:hypothetical protein